MALVFENVLQPAPVFTARESCGGVPDHARDFLFSRNWNWTGDSSNPSWSKAVTSMSTHGVEEPECGATFTWIEAISWEMYRTLFMAKGPGD